MKTTLLSSLFGVLLLTSCSTAYRAGQTPDDVYFSPGKQVGGEEYATNRKEQEEYQDYISSQDDAYLRRLVNNRNRWSSIDDFSYWNDCRYSFAPMSFNHFNSFYNCFTCPTFNAWGHPFFPLTGGWGFNGAFFNWNLMGGWYGLGGGLGWNNPFFTVINYGSPKFSAGYGPSSMSNLSAARNRSYNNSNYSNFQNGGTGNTSRSFGSLMRSVFSPAGGGYDGGTYSRPVRSFGSGSSGTFSAPSSSAGGFSGGFGSVGSSASGGRGGRGN